MNYYLDFLGKDGTHQNKVGNQFIFFTRKRKNRMKEIQIKSTTT